MEKEEINQKLKDNQGDWEENIEDLIIIGGGPAGLTAAIYAGRAGLKPVVINGPQPGGQIINTYDLENFPGFPEGISGGDFGSRLMEQAERFQVKMDFDIAEKVNFQKEPFTVTTSSKTYRAESVIIAAGAQPRPLGLEGEKELTGEGISYCATCDGALYRDRQVAVVGGGNVALEEADFLTRFARKVYLIHRREEFRADEMVRQKIANNPKVECLCHNRVVEFISSEGKLSGLKVEETKTGKISVLDDISALFVAIGYEPNTEIFRGQLELDEAGYIKTGNFQRTSVAGVFAAGDIQDSRYQQVITAAASGARAAMEADRYLQQKRANGQKLQLSQPLK